MCSQSAFGVALVTLAIGTSVGAVSAPLAITFAATPSAIRQPTTSAYGSRTKIRRPTMRTFPGASRREVRGAGDDARRGRMRQIGLKKRAGATEKYASPCLLR